MKKILLSSAALVAFAGAAAADITWDGGSAELEYNSNDGYSWELSTGITWSQELNNGWTAGASVGVDIADDDLGSDLEAADLEIFIKSDMGGLYFGDTDTAAGINYSAPKALEGIENDFDTDAFSDFETTDAVLRAEAMIGGVSAAVSQNIDGSDVDGLQFSASMELGGATVSVAYQDDSHDGYDGSADDFIDGEALALAVETTFGGADVSFGYQDSDSYGTSVGVGVSYTAGAATVGGYFTSNDSTDDAWGIDVSYDVSDEVTVSAEYESDDSWELALAYDAAPITVDVTLEDGSVWALDATYAYGADVDVQVGFNSDDEYYAAVMYDLGGGATLSAAYLDGDDELDPGEDYNEGTTVRLGLSF